MTSAVIPPIAAPLKFRPLFSRLAGLAVCASLLPAPALFAGENETVLRPAALRLNAESAIQAALAKNFSIEVQRFEPRIARENVTSALGRFDPVFDLSVKRDETSQRNAFASGGQIDPVTGLEITPFSAGVRLPVRRVNRLDNFSAGLRGGTPLGVSYDLGLGSRNNLGVFNGFTDDLASTASLGLTVPLLRGAGPAANLAQVRIARNNVLVSEWALKSRVIDTITTTFVYNELHLAHEISAWQSAPANSRGSSSTTTRRA